MLWLLWLVWLWQWLCGCGAVAVADVFKKFGMGWIGAVLAEI
jgi:hypothetical protein